MSEAQGTFECPICGWPKPHSHRPDEIAERPAIDGARIAFEKIGRKFFADTHWAAFKDLRSGYWWGFEGDRARNPDGDGGMGWAHRDYPQGPYSHTFTNIMWQFWRLAWLAAKATAQEAVGEKK